MELKYRPAQDKDYEFCRKTHHLGMRPYVEPLWGWDPLYQDSRYKKLFTPATINIIQINKLAIGYLETVVEEDFVKLVNLILVPACRNQGIGTQVLEHLIATAKLSTKKITLNVLSNNPSQNLYYRLGFVKVAQDDNLLRLELVF